MMTGAEFAPVLPAPSQPPSNPRVPLPPSPALPSESGYQPQTYTGTGPPVCLGCSQPITDQFVLQVQGHTWHSRCLRCSSCQTTLSHTCYAGNQQIYCQNDFYRLFGAQCSSCKSSIPPTEVVRCAHGNVYHLDCFRCQVCACLFDTGDQFYLSTDGRLLCQADFHSVHGKPGQDENSNPDPWAVLMEYYLSDTHPSREAMERTARALDLEAGQVRAWFRTQRAKDRRKGNNRGNPACSHSVLGRVPAPPGGYPLPIVNKARSPARLSKSANLPHDAAHLSISHAPSHSHAHPSLLQSQMPSQWEELWSNDFVPPNVDLQPDHLKNGEVIRLVDAPPPPPPQAPPPSQHVLLPPGPVLQSHPSSGAQGPASHHSNAHQHLQQPACVVAPSNQMMVASSTSGLSWDT